MTTKKTDDAVVATDAGATGADTSVKHYATQNFTDAGTERSFEKDAPLTDLDAGTLGNYAAAGLATTDKPKTSA